MPGWRWPASARPAGRTIRRDAGLPTGNHVRALPRRGSLRKTRSAVLHFGPPMDVHRAAHGQALLESVDEDVARVVFERADIAACTDASRPAALVGWQRCAVLVRAGHGAIDHVARRQKRMRAGRAAVILEHANFIEGGDERKRA